MMNIKLLNITLALAAISAAPAFADNAKNVLDIKESITDSNIVYPESYETDTQKLLEGWYLKNYTATDDRYKTQGDVNADDETIKRRLSQLNTVIELPYNQIVRSYIDRYVRRGRAQVAALLGLSHYYMPIFEQALEEQGLPLELKYLPVIESGLDPNAVSKHGATGLWQFMLATGKGLDLEVSSLVDERRDPYASSRKAAKYLKDLYSAYNDWSLAIAAYNCGPGTVNKALRRAGADASTHDFWAIYYYLPAETRGYVPMFIAANYVMNYYPYHNISPVLATKPLVTDTIMVSDRVHFNQISKVLDIPVDELRVLNPQFRADVIPGRPEKMYTLVLPSQQIQAYIMSEDDILAYEADKYARRTEVEPGDSPSAQEAKEIENEADRELAQLADDAPLEPAVTQEPAPVRRSGGGDGKGSKTVSHKVEPGETLAAIAKKYDVTTQDIKSWNNLTRNSLRTGQMLRITTSAAIADASGAREVAPAKTESKSSYPPKQENWKSGAKNEQASSSRTSKTQGSGSKKSTKKKSASSAAPKSYSVKSGDNLTTIAKKHGTTVAELKKANGLKGDALRPGQTLKLPAKAKASSSKSKSSKSSKSKKKRK